MQRIQRSGDHLSESGSGAASGEAREREAWPLRLLAGFRARIEPGLPTRRALARTIAALAGLGLALQLASHAVTDDARVRGRIVAALTGGEVYDPADPETGHLRFSECMQLSILAREAGESDLRATLAMEALKWDGAQALCESLTAALAGQSKAEWFSYSRYWHGGLVIQRLWLDSYNYGALTEATRWLALIAVAAFALALAWRVSPLVALVTAGLGVALSDVATASILPTQGISLAALFGGAAVFLLLPARWSAERVALAAFAIGAAYNYFDFLYNPGLLAGLLGWIAVLTGIGTTRSGALAWRAAGITAMALIGYIAMWAAKWALCCLYMAVTFDFFKILGPSNATRWMLGGETSLWLLEAVWLLTTVAFAETWRAVIAAAAVTGALVIAWRRGVLDGLWLAALPLGLTVMTLEFASGHSVSHGFTWRAIPWVLAAFCGAAAALAFRPHAAAVKPAGDAAPQGDIATVVAGD